MSLQCFSECFFQEGLLFLKEKKIVLTSGRECHTKGWKRDQKGPKKKIQIFFTARALVQWIHFTSVRVVHVNLCTESLILTRRRPMTIRKMSGFTDKTRNVREFLFVFYETIKRELKKRLIYEWRCDVRLNGKDERSTRLTFTVFRGGLEHLQPKDSDEVY